MSRRRATRFVTGECVSCVAEMISGAPQPVGGNVIEFSGSMTGTTFINAVNAAAAGPLTVRPAVGQSTFTVTTPFVLNRQNVTIQHATLLDMDARASGSGWVIEDSTIRSIYMEDCDNWIFRRSMSDHQHVADSFGNSGWQFFRCANWQILDSTFQGHTVDANPGQHTEALYIASGNNGGLVSGCTFQDGGSTAHIFFTWWGNSTWDGVNESSLTTSEFPRNLCVTNCTLLDPINPYQQCVGHEWLYTVDYGLNIRVNPNCTTSGGQELCIPVAWVGACS